MNAQQLRNSILQEAIQGRLVPQDPTDEPASVLLQRIRKEKERLVKEGKLKKKDLESKPIAADEIPFEIPKGWEWVRLKNVFNIVSARRVHEKDWRSNGIPFYRAREIGKLAEFGKVNNDLYIDKELFDEFSKSGVPKEGDLMITAVGTLGKVYIVKRDDVFYYKDGSVLCLENRYGLDPHYIKIAIESPIFIDQYKGESQGTTVATLTMVRLNEYLFPLPPLSEQRRIVAKIEELLPLVEQYGKAQAELEELNCSLPDKLKKSVLQEAIQGRLVPQDPTDEPASVLLQRIRKEKERLVKEGKLKKKDLENKPIEEEEIPFEIPKGWEWVRICDISRSYIGLSYAPNEVSQNGIIVLRSSNIKNGKIDLSDIVRVKKEISDKLLVEKNDIIICARNGSKKLVGKSAIITNIEEPMTFGAFMAICKTQFYKYVYVFLQSDLFFSQLRNVSSTTTINQLTQNNFNNFLIPIPPLSEQHRIVNKIEELFKKIDGLKG